MFRFLILYPHLNFSSSNNAINEATDLVIPIHFCNGIIATLMLNINVGKKCEIKISVAFRIGLTIDENPFKFVDTKIANSN